MKVFALGGYGKAGLPATKLLAQSDLVTEIAVAGRHRERAEAAAAEIGPKGIPVRVDGSDEKALTEGFADCDIIMNAAYGDTVLPAVRAAIGAGKHYCDVASFGGFVRQVLKLSSAAEAAGITAIIANGISPCISNLMGVHVARQLEQVEQLQIGRADLFSFETAREFTPRQWREDPEESFAAFPEFRSLFAFYFDRLQKEEVRTVLEFQDGGWVERDPIENGVDVSLTQGGSITAYPFFSGDDFWGMLPRDLAPVSPAEMWFTPLPPQLVEVLRAHAARVIAGEIDAEAATSAFYDTIERDPHSLLTLQGELPPITKMWVRAVGHKAGRAARCSCWFTAPMWNVGGWFLTSVALAVAVRMIARGEVRERGVMHAEKAFEPKSYFNEVVAVLPEPPSDGKLIGESFEWLE
jgi:saccharopine dehydrogenase-like NADP-dependent oxidoreductase